MAARIIGTGSYYPSDIVSNDLLSNIVNTNDEWIRGRTGIRERRIAKDEGTSSMAIKASLKALKDAKIDPLEIDLIIVATMSADSNLPNTACEVQESLKAINAICFDINVACTGFVYAVNTAKIYMDSGLCNTALIIGAETISKLIDWSDRSTCVLFGDGAGAVVLKNDKIGIIDMVMGSDGSKKDALTCSQRGLINLFHKKENKMNYLKMEGQEVFRFAVRKVPECILELLKKSNTKIDDIKFFVLHQANERILKSVAKKLNVSEEKLPMNLDRYGNTSAASIPILLDELNKKGQLKPFDKIVISGFGGGLTWGATLIEW